MTGAVSSGIRGDADRMFLSGGQIDGFGNTNVTAIGLAGRPKVKLGGGGGCARLVHVLPDVGVADIRTAPGFPLEVAGDLRTVPPPSTAELATVRSVDPLKVRASEFSRRELDRAFERGDGRDCAC